MARPIWPRSLLWLGAGVIEVHGVAACFLLFELVAIVGFPFWEALQRLPWALIFFSFAAALSSLVVAPVLWLWARLVRRNPWLEESAIRMAIGLVGLSLALSGLIGGLSSWENLIDRSGHLPPFIGQALEIAMIVGPWVLIAVALPRLTVPALHAGVFAPAGDTPPV